mgnify:CR=1 FL=1
MEQRGVTVWFTGLSGAGKTTICDQVQTELRARGLKFEVLDGDIVRTNLTKGLGFSKEDRDENIRRIGFVSNLLTRNGVIVLVAAISPYREMRDEQRERQQRPARLGHQRQQRDRDERRDAPAARARRPIAPARP